MNRLPAALDRLTRLAFGACLFLFLFSHAGPANPGPFGRPLGPLPTLPNPWGGPIGPAALLPLLVLLTWPAGRLLAGRAARSPWSWGAPAVTLPWLFFTGVVLGSIRGATLASHALPLALFWFVYLFLLNGVPRAGGRPLNLLPVFLLVLLGQSAVALAQFAAQRRVGLDWLGEPPLDLGRAGTSVAFFENENWLRGYGLASHPNQLGLLLAVLLLLVWPLLWTDSARQRTTAALAIAAGAAGLLASLSRSAWLALAAGLALYLAAGQPRLFPTAARPAGRRLRRALGLALLAGLLTFFWFYGDLLAGRFWRLDTTLESRSLFERQRDLGLAVAISAGRPWQGVGLGGYLAAARRLKPEAELVHNVPLLLGAELGLQGFLPWLVLLIAPLLQRGAWRRPRPPAVWLAMILIGLVQPEPNPFLIKGAVLWALASALWSTDFLASAPAGGLPAGREAAP